MFKTRMDMRFGNTDNVIFPDMVLQVLMHNLNSYAEMNLYFLNGAEERKPQYLNKTQLRALTGQSEKINNEAVARLEGACLVNWGEEERAKMYYLTANGKRLCELLNGRDSQDVQQ